MKILTILIFSGDRSSIKYLLDDIVKLYLKGLLSFERKFDIDIVGPSNEHMIRYKWYVINMDKSKTIKDIKKVVKDGKL